MKLSLTRDLPVPLLPLCITCPLPNSGPVCSPSKPVSLPPKASARSGPSASHAFPQTSALLLLPFTPFQLNITSSEKPAVIANL